MFGIDTSMFMPHGHCILWSPQLLIPMVIGESLTILSFFLIPVGLFRFIKLRKDLAFDVRSIVYLFIMFIFLCGVSHLISTWNYWNSDYFVELFFKLATGIVSFVTMIVFYRNKNKLLLLPSPGKHQELVNELQVLNSRLEELVVSRTEELKIKNANLNMILDSVDDGIIKYIPVYDNNKVVDFKSRVVNNRALEIYGLDSKEPLETDSICRDFPHIMKSGHFSDCLEVLKSGGPILRDPLISDYDRKYYRIYITKDTENNELFVFFSDVSQRENSKLNLMSTSKLAAVGELAGGVAHEINTPLQILDGNIRKLKRNVDINDKAEESLEVIQETIKRITSTVRNLKRLSSGEKSKIEKMNVNELVSSVLEFHAQKIISSRVDFVVNNNIKDDTYIYVNEVSFNQIISNLLNNAVDELIDASANQRVIQFNVYMKDNHVTFEVTDNGRGVDTQYVERIFDPLFTTKEVGSGTGLGLSLSKRLAIDMKADLLFVQDEITRFQLVFEKG